MNSVFQQIDDLKAQWVAAQPLSEAKHEELWRKFRLEWNYNSNHIEGNTLTYGETALLLIMGQTKGDHTIREYDEMKAHDTAVAKIAEMAKAGDILRETDLRDLNKIILKEPYWTEAVTESGQQTSVEIVPGDYKRFPNNVKSPTGEPILFASPTDTPAQVAELVAWMQGESQTPQLHSLAFAALLHHRFLKIHPFADGNGRVARLLANYVLLRAGFPPLIVKSKDKAAYIAALRVADVGDPKQLTEYFAQEMRWSLDIALRAARGESIEEPNDFEKEISVFVQSFGKLPESKPRSVETLNLAYEHSWKRLFTALENGVRKFKDMFVQVGGFTDPASPGKFGDFGNYFQHMFANRALEARRHGKAQPNYECNVGFVLRGLKADKGAELSFSTVLHFAFQEFTYSIQVAKDKTMVNVHSSLYGYVLTDAEITEFTKQAIQPMFEAIRRATNKAG